MKYQTMLLAVELESGVDELAFQQAQELAQLTGGKLYLVHAVEHMSSYGAAYGVAAGADIEEMLLQNATEAMNKLGDKVGIPADRRIIKIGPAKLIVLDEAERINADLIVVGSHGRHGMRLLLGSTANAILHGAKCDVLAVRLKD